MSAPGTGAPELSEGERAEVARLLANAVEGEVRFDLHNRMLYATDASLYQVEPIGVVIPASVEDAARAVEFCAGRGLAVLPRGGGTSLAGQCTNRAVVIDFSARHGLIMNVPFKSGMIGTFDSQLAHEFFQGFVNHAFVTLHIDNLRGENAHHQAETVFKAFARALRSALEFDPRAAGTIPSTKGSL